jgi:hypothetical protein
MAALMRHYGEEIISKADLQNDGETITRIKLLLVKEEELTNTIIAKKQEKEFNIQKDNMRQLERSEQALEEFMLESEYLNKVVGDMAQAESKIKIEDTDKP